MFKHREKDNLTKHYFNFIIIILSLTCVCCKASKMVVSNDGSVSKNNSLVLVRVCAFTNIFEHSSSCENVCYI